MQIRLKLAIRFLACRILHGQQFRMLFPSAEAQVRLRFETAATAVKIEIASNSDK